jgi:succinyl-CoA synthetase alpha subunit
MVRPTARARAGQLWALGCGGREVCADNEIKRVSYFRHSENTEYIIFHSCNNNLEREGFFLL